MVQGAIAGIVAFTWAHRLALQGLLISVCIRWCQRGKTQANRGNHSLAGRNTRNGGVQGLLASGHKER
jgi:hypothetical protein